MTEADKAAQGKLAGFLSKTTTKLRQLDIAKATHKPLDARSNLLVRRARL